MPRCPNCDAGVSNDQNFCTECGTDISEIDLGSSTDEPTSFREQVRAEIDDQQPTDDTPADVSEHLGGDPQGEWVNAERVQKVADLLDPGETVHYMWRGGTIDVEGSSAGESIFGNDRDRKSSLKGIFTAVTSDRIVIAIPQFLGDDERHVPYHSVTSVDLDTGLVNRRVSIQTKGQTYHIQSQGPSKDELREAMKFIRDKVDAFHSQQPAQAASEPDPTEQLQNLKELHDDGVLTDAEFEEKKQSLLDEL